MARDTFEKKKLALKNNKNYYYWIKKKANKDTLVILPGFSGTHSDQLPFARNLVDNFQIIIPDYPGWGSSDTLDAIHSLSQYAAFIHEILKQEKIQRCCILGHCMGSSLAIEYTYKYPKMVKRLFLICPPYADGSIIFRMLKNISTLSLALPKKLRPLCFFWRSRVINTFLAFFVLKFKTLSKKLRYIKKNFDRSLEIEEIVEENWISLLHFDFNKIKSIKTPIHLVFGEKDLIISKSFAHKFHCLTPRSTIEFIPQAGHLPPIETPKTLARIIKKYA